MVWTVDINFIYAVRSTLTVTDTARAVFQDHEKPLPLTFRYPLTGAIKSVIDADRLFNIVIDFQ